ncbi:---NA---, partial [Olea europaea subsp. europaea]
SIRNSVSSAKGPLTMSSSNDTPLGEQDAQQQGVPFNNTLHLSIAKSPPGKQDISHTDILSNPHEWDLVDNFNWEDNDECKSSPRQQMRLCFMAGPTDVPEPTNPPPIVAIQEKPLSSFISRDSSQFSKDFISKLDTLSNSERVQALEDLIRLKENDFDALNDFEDDLRGYEIDLREARAKIIILEENLKKANETTLLKKDCGKCKTIATAPLSLHVPTNVPMAPNHLIETNNLIAKAIQGIAGVATLIEKKSPEPLNFVKTRGLGYTSEDEKKTNLPSSDNVVKNLQNRVKTLEEFIEIEELRERILKDKVEALENPESQRKGKGNSQLYADSCRYCGHAGHTIHNCRKKQHSEPLLSSKKSDYSK